MNMNRVDPTAVRGPLLIPREGGAVDYFADGLLVGDDRGVLEFAGNARAFEGLVHVRPRPAAGVMLPPLLDHHTHISQHPIRGHFVDGVPDNPPPPEGRLLAGLNRNVFPAELRCADEAYARTVAEAFLADTLSHGVVGGAAFMTTSAAATRVALGVLPHSWSVGLVLMNQHCPKAIHTDEASLKRDVEQLAERFGRRVIVTDRFAVAVDTPLRRRAAALARRLGLRTQTHLNEQRAEKRFVERELYPGYDSYTDVYRRDGLLNHACILAHCVEMRDAEWDIVADTGSVIAHCPTSNLLLGSDVMPLDEVMRRGLPWALATDVGASPTVSMLAEMRRFMQVHAGRSTAATATEALYRSTLAPSTLLNLTDTMGLLEPRRPMSFIEVQPRDGATPPADTTAEAVAESLLPDDPDRPAATVGRVTLAGRVVFERLA